MEEEEEKAQAPWFIDPIIAPAAPLLSATDKVDKVWNQNDNAAPVIIYKPTQNNAN